MKAAAIALLALMITVGMCATAPANDGRQGQPTFGQPGGQLPAPAAPNAGVQPQRFYGYVPPPPLLHTWPGGYRVIRHELSNTLADHIGGHY